MTTEHNEQQARALAELTSAAGLMLSEIDTSGHEVDPAYRATLFDAWEQGKAALAASPVVKQNLTTQPAAPPPAVAGVIDDMKVHPDGSGYVAVCWQRVPDGFELGQPACVVAPVTAAPADTWFADQLTAMGEVIPLDSTPAAPGIDLAAEHEGMRVDYHGLLRQAQDGLRGEPGIAEMIRQLHDHLTELGRRWYTGDRRVVDEFLQLYCIESDARRTLIDASSKGGSDLIACVERIEEAIEHRVPHDIYGTVHVELAEIRRLAPAPTPDAGSEARGAVVVEGVIEFQRSDASKPKTCICCPDQPQHIYGRSVNWEGESWTDFNALETAIRKHFTYKNENEGRRLRVTVEVVPPQASDAEVRP